MFDYRVSVSRRTVAAAASLVAVGLLAACNSASTSASAGGGGTATSAAPVTAATATAYPAPSGGNGGATAPGVTATEIKTATLYDGSGAAGGLNPGILRGVQAYYAYINSEGGVYGRKLVTTGLDSGYTPTSSASVCTQYAGSVFAFVGSLSVVDSGCLPPVQKAKTPYIGVKIDPAFSSYSGYRDFESGPPSTLAQGPFAYYAKSHPSVKKIAMIWVNNPGLAPYEKIWAKGWESVGVQVVYNVGVNPGTSNYTPYVVAAKNAGAEGIDTSTTSFSDTTLIAKTMDQQGWNPALKVSAFAYDKDWLPETGNAGMGWLAYIGELPFLSPSDLSVAPGGKLFSTWMTKEFSGTSPDVYAAFGWTNAALFVQGLVKAGPKLTSAGLLSGIDGLASFDADGMIGTQNKPVGVHNVNSCFIVLEDQAATGVATRIYPKTGFDCSDQKLVTANGLVNGPGAG
jgi:branched-chain amino acid transport system substrate-binding protein